MQLTTQHHSTSSDKGLGATGKLTFAVFQHVRQLRVRSAPCVVSAQGLQRQRLPPKGFTLPPVLFFSESECGRCLRYGTFIPDRPNGPWRCLVAVTVSLSKVWVCRPGFQMSFDSFFWYEYCRSYVTLFHPGVSHSKLCLPSCDSQIFSSSLLAGKLARPRHDAPAPPCTYSVPIGGSLP